MTSDFAFRASGGDDDSGDLDVEVVTVQPPRVAGIRATISPPAYTGREPVVQSGGAIEALEGSAAALHVTATSEVARAALVFLESGREIELRAETVTDDAGTREVLTAAFPIERGAEIDPRESRYGRTPLGWASHGDHEEVIALLARHSRDVRTLAFRGFVERLRDVTHDAFREPRRSVPPAQEDDGNVRGSKFVAPIKEVLPGLAVQQ